MYSLAVVDGDWDFSINSCGRISQGTDLLCQMFALNLKTPLGTNKMEPDFGSNVEYGNNPQHALNVANRAELDRLQQAYSSNPTQFTPDQVPVSVSSINTGQNQYQAVIYTLGNPTSFSFSLPIQPYPDADL